MSTLNATLATFRAALLRRDEATIRALVAAYEGVETRLTAQIRRLTTIIARDGETVATLRERNRLQTLERQIRDELDRYATTAQTLITSIQSSGITHAVTDAPALIAALLSDAQLPALSLVQLNPRAVESIIGVLADGSPVRSILDQWGDEVARRASASLVYAVASGRNPNDTAKSLRKVLRISLYRAARIARTEHLRAYRTATQQTYQSNRAILRGWQWRASPSRRTCPVCLAMDGREFPLDTPFASHVNCRCTTIPLLIGRDAPPHESGIAWFDRQPPDVQQEMLGAGKFALYQAGRLRLGDLVGIHDSPVWGMSRYEIPLKDLDT